MSSTGLRFKKYLEYKGVKRSDFSESTDIPYNSLSSILNGNRNISSDVLEKMFTFFPELNARWLVTGNGPMEYTIASYNIDKEDSGGLKSSIEDNDPVGFDKETTEKLLQEFIKKDEVRDAIREMINEVRESSKANKI
ncbi:hypothetical protein [Myroides marinus]|uniref:hypothetical protein n=1 Tax=Myroides marinus TaxID=703342 RepID=UPI002578F137|nr:hypothetical protein [Myroides marinus]MDM1378198.1 helix-turn-helix transcriptional regulator [Myroides marinus]MDM1385416.1 helix-turn-helix transcriptional regulator [Myroides marinus]MDM1392629.1 helix-turn-helix transcriptional regulator [Myroides marinus]